ncbi:putative membrane protein [Alkalihalobacillus xiaoxiensis]|uniref:Membrane protein n=1 Tax=Shouchella xiaoxiensis TaxID=766895 RepID=A0ABS2SZ58_9BACI|nr:hypothetical protein [Shouchella xiaoxiensis]MBM7840813.1 putative membrane protein [Shouchella xiaoxiensis]
MVYKAIVLFIHLLFILFGFLLMIGGPSAPDYERNMNVAYFFLWCVIGLIIASCWMNVRWKKWWLLLLSVIAIPFFYQFAIELSLIFGYD